MDNFDRQTITAYCVTSETDLVLNKSHEITDVIFGHNFVFELTMGTEIRGLRIPTFNNDSVSDTADLSSFVYQRSTVNIA